MEQLKRIIKNEILPNTESLNGYSIFKNDRTFDIYIPTKTIEDFYFVSFTNGNFFDINNNQIQLSEIHTCKYSTADIIEKNHPKILNYSEIFIQEHDRLNYGDYKSPKETNAEEYLNMGYKAFETENYEEAYNYYCRAINLKPYDPSYYAKRASCFIKSKQYENAITDICRAGISNPVSKQNIFTFTYEELGDIYRMANDYRNAIKFYTITFDNTQLWWLLHKRAICYSHLGIYDKSIRDFETILNKDRKIELLVDFAEVCLKGEFIDKAKIVLNEVINISSDNEEEWIMRMLESKNKPYKDKARRLLSNIQ